MQLACSGHRVTMAGFVRDFLAVVFIMCVWTADVEVRMQMPLQNGQREKNSCMQIIHYHLKDCKSCGSSLV